MFDANLLPWLASCSPPRRRAFVGEEWIDIRPSDRKREAIRELIDGDPVLREIVQYFARHTEAAETARGIADWWIRREIGPTVAALAKLLMHGLITPHVAGGAMPIYRFTRNLRDRQHVWECLTSSKVP